MSEGNLVLAKLLEIGSVGSFRDLDEELFLDDETEVYGFVQRHLREYQRLPSVTLVENETGHELEVGSDAYSYYLDRLEDRFLYNQVRPIFGEIREQLSNREVRPAIENFRRASTVVNRISRASPVTEMADLSHRIRQQFDEGARLGMNPGITTGYPELDRRILGHQNGDLNFIVARMGVGKTMIQLRNALAARENGANVMVVSMEMTDIQLGHRAAFLETGIDTKYMRNFRMSWHNRRMFNRFLEQMQGWSGFKIFNGNMAGTVDQIEALMYEYRPDILFIDGAYLLKSSYESRYNVDRNQNVAYVADALKRLAAVTDRPISATTQFNRQAGKGGRQGSLENLGFTDAIAQHSSIVSALVYSKNGANKRVLRQIKTREGGEGNLEINYAFKPKNFDAIGWVPDEEEEEGRSRNNRNLNAQPVSTDYMA